MQALSDRTASFTDSVIRRMTRISDEVDAINLSQGFPDFPPPKAITDRLREVADEGPHQYSVTFGAENFREALARKQGRAYGREINPDTEILVTCGGTEAMMSAMMTVCNPGDKVIVEDPTYLVALQSFHFFDPEILPVTINPDGIDCDALAAAVAANPDVKFAYVIPNFQNPTGLSYSQQVHDRVVEIFRGTDIVVLEDNPYRELRFSGTATDSFGKELGEQCCMLGTFSKIVAPGMRIGWVCVRNKELREKLLSYKATADLHTNIFSQLVLAQYLADNDIDAHIEKTKVLYKHKAELMMDCMRKYLPQGVEFTPTEGGMFLWAKLPNGMSAVDLYRVALTKGVAICPGDPFYEKARNVSTFRINYSNSSDEVIEKGIRLLGEACEELLAK